MPNKLLQSSDNLTAAYSVCRRVTMEHAKTFYLASFFLPRQKRNACYAVYAFCRYIDDLIDKQVDLDNGVITRATIDTIITRWQADLDLVYAGTSVERPVMLAWADILQNYAIPRTLPDELIEGVMMDSNSSIRIGTFEELYHYCYKVASVVGLMTCEIFGYTNPDTPGYAVDLGIAMQLTNILRDIGEDLSNNRIYLPAEELNQFGLSEHDIASRVLTPQFRELMKFQIQRAREYYRRANIGIQMLEQDSRLTVRLMSHNYAKILDSIEANDYDVFSRRAYVPLHKKLMTIPTLWYSTVRAA